MGTSEDREEGMKAAARPLLDRYDREAAVDDEVVAGDER